MVYEQESTRAGRYVRQLEGYRAFVPAQLPPNPALRLEGKLTHLLSEADQELGRLDGVASILPSLDFFLKMFVRQEAVLSSRIEGTQSTLTDVLRYHADATSRGLPPDVREVDNYVKAMNHGLGRLSDSPLCNRLIREIHAVLLEDVRGSERTPGEFRRSQNWIGPAGCGLKDAEFVPPSVTDMGTALGDFERFLNDRMTFPALVSCALAHAQFETIHPFLDGNGRVGRLLITLLLRERQILRKPLLYLSLFFKRRKQEYYSRLTAIRLNGDWEGWVEFFLNGVVAVSRESSSVAHQIMELRERDFKGSANPPLIDVLFAEPVVSIQRVADRLGLSLATAGSHVRKLEKKGLLIEITGRKRGRLYSYEEYIGLFAEKDGGE